MGNEIPWMLGEFARFQAGVVTRRQALGSGVSTNAITSKLRHERWRQIHRGVYATFTGPVSREAQLWAAVLYAGKGARLSHQTAAEVHGLSDGRASLIHVTIPANRRVRPANGLSIHISARTDPGASFPRGVLPRTCAEETVLDLVHAGRDIDEVCGWVTSAFGRRLTKEGPLRATMTTRKKLRWRRQLDEMITAAAGGAHSVLEFRYDRDVERAHGLPAARHQVPFTKPDGRRGFRDRYYAEFGLVVELDGKQAHPDERSGADVRRDNAATAGGGATLRYDWRAVRVDACATAAQVADALRSRGWTGRLKPCSASCGALGHPDGSRPRRKAAHGKAALASQGSSARRTRRVSVRSGSTACAAAARCRATCTSSVRTS